MSKMQRALHRTPLLTRRERSGQKMSSIFGLFVPTRGSKIPPGVYTTIDPPGSHLTEPISINAKGQIVGVYREQGEPGDDLT
jgi:hypothetical protein